MDKHIKSQKNVGLGNLKIEERASEDKADLEVELEFDTSEMPTSARTKPGRGASLEEPDHSGINISPVLRNEESKLQGNDSVISSINMGDETHESVPSMPTKTSFISIEEADASAEPTPAFGRRSKNTCKLHREDVSAKI